MIYLIYFIIYFIFFSFIGWILDSSYSSLVSGKIIYGGIFKSWHKPIPLAPIYGFGAMLLTISHDLLKNSGLLFQLVYLAITLSSLEYIGGWLSVKILKRRVWDYSDSFLNIHGHTDIWHTISWTILGLIFLRLHPAIDNFLKLVGN